LVAVIDLHSHVLPGVDDGAPTVEASLEMARAAVAAGTTELVATPHVTFDIPTSSQTVRDGVAALQPQLDAAGIELRLHTGGELGIARATDLDDAELAALRLGGGEWLLAECPLSSASAAGFEQLLHHLQARGHRILLGHPERSPALQRDPERLRRLVDAGMLASITAGSLTGRFGGTVQRFTHDIVEAGLVHNVASDAHDAVRRPPGMRAAIEEADADLPGLAGEADWLTVDVPAAILRGGPVPRRPGEPPRRRRRGLFRRAARGR
jgi:protein-tyrosine phosphatase